MSTFTILWLAWLAMFLIVEGVALANTEPGDTLSETIWRWASMKGQGKLWRLRRLALLILLAWLSAHFLTGGKF